MPGLEIVKLAPPPSLAQHLQGLDGYREAAAPLRRREVPAAGAVIVISLGPDMWVDGGWTGSFAAGLYDRPVVTGHGGEQAGLQLYVAPLSAAALFGGMPPSELFNRTVALEDVMPRARELTERVAEAPSWAARAAVLADVMHGVEPPRVRAEVRYAYDRLVASHGSARVEQLARETGWSRRHLAERFRRDVGMAPKAFARLLRFQHAVALLRSGAPLADAAYACGYADQPHMNRDFRDFLGAPPGELPFVQDPLPAP